MTANAHLPDVLPSGRPRSQVADEKYRSRMAEQIYVGSTPEAEAVRQAMVDHQVALDAELRGDQ